MKVLRTDNGGEYMSKQFQEYLSKQGILHQTSCPYNPQQNGVAERKNRHLMEVTRALMFYRQVPKRFWGDAVMTACYLINRTPTKILKDESPYKVLNKNKPNLEHLRVFGCVCYVLVPGELRHKLAARSKKCVFIGYSPTQKGYKCYDPETRKVHVSRDVKFIEGRGYYEDRNWEELKDLPEPTLDRAASLHYLLNRLGVTTEASKKVGVTLGKGGSSEGYRPPDTDCGTQDTGRGSRDLGREPQDASRRLPGVDRGTRDADKGSRGIDRALQDMGRMSKDAVCRSQATSRVPQKARCGSQDTGRGCRSMNTGRRPHNAGPAGDTSDSPLPDLPVRPGDPSDRSETSDSQSDQPDPSENLSGYPTGPRASSDQLNTSEQPIQQPRRSTRLRSDPSNWKNTRVYYNAHAVAQLDRANFSADLVPSSFRSFLGTLEKDVIPQTYDEAKQNKDWVKAIEAETMAMERNHTWVESELPPGKKAVTSKWVFTIKYKSNGVIERFKARLVARGFTQTYGVDYTDTFAPVAKLHTVRVLLSLATNLSWGLWQMDVKNAFLQGELDEEVYMTPPPGLETRITPGKVLRLRKAIYGLKQSPRAWYHKLSHTLRDRGFRKSEADHTLFTSTSSRGIVVVLIYVDDLIISGDDKAGIEDTKSFLHSIFDIKDLGALTYFLGIEICRTSYGLLLSQRKYTLDLLQETGFDTSKPAKTPLEDGYKVSRKGEHDDEPFEDITAYRRIIGKLIYLTISRPDLCFAVNQVSQHMQAPTKHHWSMVERILRYIKGSSNQGVWMGKNMSSTIAGYCDADWAGDRNDRKSTTGYCTFIGGNLVTWKTKKQKVVACSSAEAEYRAMRRLSDELVWLKALLKDLGQDTKDPITMHCDNQAAIHIASNPVFHERTKHVEVDCHKVRERIEDGIVLPCYTPSKDQLADVFTKAASSKVCAHIYGKLGLVSLDQP